SAKGDRFKSEIEYVLRERDAEITRPLETRALFKRQTFQNGFLGGGRQAGTQCAQLNSDAFLLQRVSPWQLILLKWKLPSHQFIGQQTQGINITRNGSIAYDLFGRHIRWSTYRADASVYLV